MPKVTFNDFAGGTHTVEVPAGTSLMRAATDNRVPGIDGDCGGNCACATCHVYVDPDWSDRVGARTATEEDMLNLRRGPARQFAACLPDHTDGRSEWARGRSA